jgi:hypothetical protein
MEQSMNLQHLCFEIILNSSFLARIEWFYLKLRCLLSAPDLSAIKLNAGKVAAVACLTMDSKPFKNAVLAGLFGRCKQLFSREMCLRTGNYNLFFTIYYDESPLKRVN